eukprot:1135-Heterococcus_DN1.PRE.1
MSRLSFDRCFSIPSISLHRSSHGTSSRRCTEFASYILESATGCNSYSLSCQHTCQQTAVLDGILCSKRDGCTGTDLALWGAGAYVMSRRGMHEFISRHMPQFLHATVQEAEQFCAVLDVRTSAPTTIADFWVYDMNDVYDSHIPLFLPLAAIAAGST